MEIGNQTDSDNAITKKYRLKQSKYRAEVLKVAAGVGPTKNATKTYGNMLCDGEVNGLNFISPIAFTYAKQKVLDKQVNQDLLIDEYRLFNNMLSSMPMCFNLFSDLRELLVTDSKRASVVIKRMFQEIGWIDTVTYIDVEFIPRPITNYTNDKSAFDALVLVKDRHGAKGLIAIETKYTDLLGSNTAKHTETKNRLLESNSIFDTEYSNYLINSGYDQIHRNYLLAYSYAKKHGYKHFTNLIISPKEDTISVKELNELQQHLILDKSTIMKLDLESIVQRAITCNDGSISWVMEKFWGRYLGF